ncbi:MAG: ATP-grasp domain-containing protein [Deltaproteobacteria bacterium]|nr:ATP-grasp domain-containing protein [Deltaproteobacteria bacterium]
MAARAWILNFDADLELAFGVGYQAPAFVAARAPELARRLAPLVAPGDVVVGPERPVDHRGDLEGLEGHAFCMTPGAARRLTGLGVVPVLAPSMEILRAANHRRFCADLGQTLRHAAFARTIEEVRSAVSGITPEGDALLKRPFGFAGRGQRRARGKLTAKDIAWLEATPVAEGIQVEPAVTIVVEHSVHGVLSPDGAVRLGPIVAQACDARGAWRGTRRIAAGELGRSEQDQALGEAERAARALAELGYHGPFGVDGFVYRCGGGRAHQPRGEINARYTMGWSLGPPGLLG